MTQTQHTPGPWFRGKQSASGWYTVRVADVGCTYARIVAETMEPGDANFIAAAPELLAVAIQAESDLAAKLAFCAGGDEIQVAAITAKLTAARAAIAKARGEG